VTLSIEKKGKVLSVIHSRPQAYNAMDPESARGVIARRPAVHLREEKP